MSPALLPALIGFVGAICAALLPMLRRQNKKLDRIEVKVNGNLDKLRSDLAESTKRETELAQRLGALEGEIAALRSPAAPDSVAAHLGISERTTSSPGRDNAWTKN